jgi:hypothetical protein
MLLCGGAMKLKSASRGLVVTALSLVLIAATSAPLWATPVCEYDDDCDDGNVCTTDHCQALACAGATGAEFVLCNTLGGCVHDNNTETCDDGDPCTIGDTCSGGSCVAGAPKDCDDGNFCTDDSCDGSGNCQHTNNTVACNDEDPCTENDTCSAGTCGGAPRDCNDADDCTVDTCDGSGNCVHTRVDSDGDGVPDACDPHPSLFDPTGCLYDEATGRVIPGGLVTPSGGPGTLHIGLNGSSGCYQFSVTDLPTDPNSALYSLSITLPPNCVRSTSCLADPNALDPTGQSDPYVLGPYNVGGYINPHDCPSNPFYLSFELSDGDPAILNNNIPLVCEIVAPPVPAPAMSPRAIAIAVLLLLGSAFVALRMRRTER